MPTSPGGVSLKLIPADEARRIMLDTPVVGVETVPLREAGGRVLAVPLAAPEDLPTGARSVMDGYAVRAADVASAAEGRPAVLRVAGVVPMGGVFGGVVGAGQAVGISTGGFMPAGADAVVMIEHTSERAARSPQDDGVVLEVAIGKPVAAGANVIQRGEDIAAGAPVLAAGRRLRPQDVAALATFGVARVTVHRRPASPCCRPATSCARSTRRPRPDRSATSTSTSLAPRSPPPAASRPTAASCATSRTPCARPSRACCRSMTA